MISASFPIIKDNQVVAVIATNLSLKPISKMVQQAMENAASNIYVLTDKGYFIGHPDYGYEDNFFEINNGFYKSLKNELHGEPLFSKILTVPMEKSHFSFHEKFLQPVGLFYWKWITTRQLKVFPIPISGF